MKKNIWIINQYASHLTTRHEELSKVFAEEGYNVAVITSSFHHGKRQYIYEETVAYDELCDGVTYVYLHSGPEYQNNGVKRILNMLDFSRLVSAHEKEIAQKTGEPSYVIASSAPPFVWEAGYKIAKKYSAKFISEFRDLWPQSLIDIQGVSPSHPLVKVLEKVEKRAYCRADAIVSTAPYSWKHVVSVANVPAEKVYWMANGLNTKEIDKSLVSNEQIPQELESFLNDHWCCIYVGSIVKSERLDYLLKAFSEVKDPDVYFAVVGEGHEKEAMQDLAVDLSLQNVEFFPAIPRTLIPKVLEKAKLCVAAHDDLPVYHYGLSMNKLNDYLYSGTPTLFACDVNNIVMDAGHFGIKMNDYESFVNTVAKVKQLTDYEKNDLKEKAQALIKRDYDYCAIGKNYIKMLESL